MAEPFPSIDDYIDSFPDDVQVVLQEVRRTIVDAVPDAEEAISYQIPTFKLRGRSFVSFAGWKQHVAVYPTPKGDEAFQRGIEPYRAGKATLRFPLGEPIPLDLVACVAALLVEERLRPEGSG